MEGAIWEILAAAGEGQQFVHGDTKHQAIPSYDQNNEEDEAQDIINSTHRFSSHCLLLFVFKKRENKVKPYRLKSFIPYLGIVTYEVIRHLFNLSEIHEGI